MAGNRERIMSPSSVLPDGSTILIVDDTPANLAVVASRLEEQNLRVLVAQDGEEAMERVEYARPDLILLDVMLPGVDGFEICRRLKADASARDIPVIFMTALGSTEDKLAAFQAGAVDYVTKPFQIEEVLARVHTHLALHFLQQELQAHNQRLETEIVERSKIELDLRAANTELDSFAHAVSHDLRGPLRQIMGCAQILVGNYGDKLPPECRPFVDQITRASQKMGGLIEGLLRLSRGSRGELESKPVDLTALAGAIRADLEQAAPDRQVEWQIDPGLDACGDPRLIEVVMRNLIENAWKYTGATAQPKIRVYADRAGGQTWFCIADNGAGFDMKLADKLFRPFQRLHREEQFPGIGVGLATVRRIIDRHGGDLAVDAAPDRGATFRFTLPKADAAQAAA